MEIRGRPPSFIQVPGIHLAAHTTIVLRISIAAVHTHRHSKMETHRLKHALAQLPRILFEPLSASATPNSASEK